MIPGETSTGSKRSAALFGAEPGPRRMVRTEGCRLWDDQGREFIDTIMALGAVALGYGHPAVTAAAVAAARDGAVGSLPPVHEEALAERLIAMVPGAEAVRFLKTGAEAVAAAVRIARVATGRGEVVSCGYHGWLDWSQTAAGVPGPVRGLHRTIPFDDLSGLAGLEAGPPPAAVVIEPVVDGPPGNAWLRGLRDITRRAGTVLVFDEIKTGLRLGPGGATGRYGVTPDLVVLGKALGNGYPIAAVAGPAPLLEAVTRTWISSTLATEFVALAAAMAVLEVFDEQHAADAIARAGRRLQDGFTQLAADHPSTVTGVRGIPEFCYVTFRTDAVAAAVAARAAARGLLFKRNAYNFAALAHDDASLDAALTRLEEAIVEVERRC